MEIPHKPHVALLASPGLGHLIPVIQLADHLALRYAFNVTILAVTSQTSQAESRLLHSASHILQIPSPDISALVPNDAEFVIRLCVLMRQARPAIRYALSHLTHPPNVFIVDIFGYESLSMAQEFNMLSYIYVASNAWFFASVLYSPVWDKQVQGQYVDQKEPLKIPGCNPVRPEDAVDPMLDRNTQKYDEHINRAKGMVKSDGILVNTWEELEHKVLQSLKHSNLLGGILKAPVYAIGPLVRSPEPVSSSIPELLTWLDQQPNESVVYASSGSGGTLSYQQTVEMAWGLELSKLRFVWVVRPPTVGSTASAFFTTGSGASEGDDPSSYLPEGFLARTLKVGLVVPQWGPQVKILAHPSVGGFLSHCGWSSTLESITNGVPMVVWPLYAEQRMNATMLAEELGVAVRPKVLPTKKLVGREEIASMLREIMEVVDEEGKRNPIREKVRKLKESARRAMEEGGSSYAAINEVIKKWEASSYRADLQVQA